PLASAAADAALTPPSLPAVSAARVAAARQAAAAGIPVLLSAPAASGRLRVARALHTPARRPGPPIAFTRPRPPLHRLPSGASLYVDVGVLAPEALLALEAVLDDGLAWVLAATDPGTTPPAGLAAHLAPVVLAVPPLASRRAELPALAASVLARLAERTQRAAPRMSPAALAQLAAHPWAGDVAELEAVLAR